jgi:hypothetical protein
MVSSVRLQAATRHCTPAAWIAFWPADEHWQPWSVGWQPEAAIADWRQGTCWGGLLVMWRVLDEALIERGILIEVGGIWSAEGENVQRNLARLSGSVLLPGWLQR